MDKERLERPTTRWEEIVDEQASMAEAYREEGWEAIELHPGDVSIRTGTDEDDRFGFDVVVPGSEFEELKEAIEAGAAFEAYELFGDIESGMAVVLAAMEASVDQLAVLYPLYYKQGRLAEIKDQIDEASALYTHVRPLNQRTIVTFTHDNPALFFAADDD